MGGGASIADGRVFVGRGFTFFTESGSTGGGLFAYGPEPNPDVRTPSRTLSTTPTSTPPAPTTVATPLAPTKTPTTDPRSLGERIVTIRSQDDCVSSPLKNGCLFSSIFAGSGASLAWTEGPIRLFGGAPNAEGIAHLSLTTDAIFALETVLGWQCVKLVAADSSGWIDCDGGLPNDVVRNGTSAQGAPSGHVRGSAGAA